MWKIIVIDDKIDDKIYDKIYDQDLLNVEIIVIDDNIYCMMKYL